MSSSSFPPAILTPGRPFPPQGSSGWFPYFLGTTSGSDFSLLIPLHFVAFDLRLSPSCVLFVRNRRARGGPPGLDQRGVHPALSVKAARAPRFPSASMRVRHALGPRQASVSRDIETSSSSPSGGTAMTPATKLIFRGSIAWLRAPCVRFAGDVAVDHATLGTGWLAMPCRAGLSPADAQTRFQLRSSRPPRWSSSGATRPPR